MNSALRVFHWICESLITLLLRAAALIQGFQILVAEGVPRLRAVLRGIATRLRPARPAPARAFTPHRRAHNRISPSLEEQIVEAHIKAPHLGNGGLRYVVWRLTGKLVARETIRQVRARNRERITALKTSSQRKRSRSATLQRSISVQGSRDLWGLDLTLVWVLGFFPLWIVGVVDYHGSRLIALEPLAFARATHVCTVLDRAIAKHGAPRRIVTDRAGIFRGYRFTALLDNHGIVHSMTKPRHPWTNGRIERLFRTFKETVKASYSLVDSRAQWLTICRDFLVFYNEHRPHSSWAGRTPMEVERGWRPQLAHPAPITFFEGRFAWWQFT